MGKSSPKAPAAPDPVATANAQAAANKEAVTESARVNQINQQTPFGNVSFTGEVGGPDRTQVVSLSEAGQGQLDRQNAIAAILGNKAVGLAGGINFGDFTLEGLPGAQKQDFSAAGDQLFQNFSGRLNEDFDTQENALRTRLANQGLAPDSEAFKSELEGLRQSKSDALTSAASTATQFAGSEQSRQLGLDQSVRNSALSDLLLSRDRPINELSAILQGTPALQAQQATPVSGFGIAPADVQGAVGQNFTAQQNAFNQQNAARNSKLGATSGLAGTLGSAFLSDEALKENKRAIDSPVTNVISEMRIERWNYNSKADGLVPADDNKQTHIGCYAQDFQNLFGVGDGRSINTVDAFGVCLQAVKELTNRINELEAQNDLCNQ